MRIFVPSVLLRSVLHGGKGGFVYIHTVNRFYVRRDGEIKKRGAAANIAEGFILLHQRYEVFSKLFIESRVLFGVDIPTERVFIPIKVH